jgi:hypothetical protein
MAKLDILRQIIKEEVVKALRQELPRLLSENINKETGIKNVIKETKKSQIPLSLNTPETYQKRIQSNIQSTFYGNSPLNDLLNETAMNMIDNEDASINFTSDDVNPVSFFQPKEASVGDVNGMLSTARQSSNLEAVQINEVPDYSNLMKKMINNGVM